MNEKQFAVGVFRLLDENGNDLIVPVKNTILDDGKNWAASRYKDNTHSGISHIGVGTDGTPTTSDMTDLVDELAYKSATVNVVNNVLTVSCVFVSGEAVGTLQEAGIWVDGKTILYNRVTFNFVKSVSGTVIAQFTVTLY